MDTAALERKIEMTSPPSRSSIPERPRRTHYPPRSSYSSYAGTPAMLTRELDEDGLEVHDPALVCHMSSPSIYR
jgi:hypothetical protein